MEGLTMRGLKASPKLALVVAFLMGSLNVVGAQETPSAAMQAIIDAARAEGQLNLTWGAASLGGSEGVQELGEAFNAHYGLDLQIQFTPGPSEMQVAATIIQEIQTGRSASSDVYIGGASSIMSLVVEDGLADGRWGEWAEFITNPASIAPGGVAVSVQTQVPGFTYNSAKYQGDLVPRSMSDLLKPEYKGRIASTPYASTWDLLSIVWGEEKSEQYVTEFEGQLGGLMRCAQPDRLLSGEFDILAFDCNQASSLKASAMGQPIAFLVPTDAAFAVDKYLGIPKNSAHPNAAKLWIDFALSRAAQDIIYSYEFMDSDLIEGSKTAELMSSIDTATEFLRADIGFRQATGEERLTTFQQKVVELFQ